MGPKPSPGFSRLDSTGSSNGKGPSVKNGSGKTSGTSSGAGTPAVIDDVSI